MHRKRKPVQAGEQTVDGLLEEAFNMTDEEILEERGKKYGHIPPMWETIGQMQFILSQFAFTSQFDRGDDVLDSKRAAHLAAMNMVIVKIVRSVYDPEHIDNYQDGRNYLTIGDEVMK